MITLNDEIAALAANPPFSRGGNDWLEGNAGRQLLGQATKPDPLREAV